MSEKMDDAYISNLQPMVTRAVTGRYNEKRRTTKRLFIQIKRLSKKECARISQNTGIEEKPESSTKSLKAKVLKGSAERT